MQLYMRGVIKRGRRLLTVNSSHLPSVTQVAIPILLLDILDWFYQSLTDGVAEPRVPNRDDIGRHGGLRLNLTFVHTLRQFREKGIDVGPELGVELEPLPLCFKEIL